MRWLDSLRLLGLLAVFACAGLLTGCGEGNTGNGSAVVEEESYDEDAAAASDAAFE